MLLQVITISLLFGFCCCEESESSTLSMSSTSTTESNIDYRENIRQLALISDSAAFTVVQSEKYVEGALVMACSYYSASEHRPLIALTSDVSEEGRKRLEEAGMHVMPVDPIANRNTAIRHETFTKLYIWNFTEFDTGLYIDADTVIVRNIGMECTFDSGVEIVATMTSARTFNSGFFCFKPSQKTFDNLIGIFANGEDKSWHRGETDNLTEQDLLIHYFVDRLDAWRPLVGCMHVTLPHLGDKPTECLAVLHFVGYPKPFEIDFSNETEWKWVKTERKDEWPLEVMQGKMLWAFNIWRDWKKQCFSSLPPSSTPTPVEEEHHHPIASEEDEADKLRLQSLNQNNMTLRDYSAEDIEIINPPHGSCIQVPPSERIISLLFTTSQVIMPAGGTISCLLNGTPLDPNYHSSIWLPRRKRVDMFELSAGRNNVTVMLLDFAHTRTTSIFWVTYSSAESCPANGEWIKNVPAQDYNGTRTITQIAEEAYLNAKVFWTSVMARRKPVFGNKGTREGSLMVMTTCNIEEVTMLAIMSLVLVEEDFAFMVIDESSHDNTVRWLQDHNVHVLQKEVPTGLTASWNMAWDFWKMSNYAVLMITNNDILVPSGSIGNLSQCVLEGTVAGPLSTQVGVGSSSASLMQGIEAYFKLNFSAALVYTDPINYQLVQDSLESLFVDEPVIAENDALNGFFMAMGENLMPLEYSSAEFFDPANVIFGQEAELLKKVATVPSLFAVTCATSFVYHFKGITVHNANLKDVYHWGNDPEYYRNLKPIFNPRQYQKLVQIAEHLRNQIINKGKT